MVKWYHSWFGTMRRKFDSCYRDQFLIILKDNIMFITLTNSSPEFRGHKVSIRKDLIVTVHRNTVTREDGVIEDVTFVYGPPHGTWEVSETLEEVVEMLK